MNGRLYDPLLRRFLNADENIQDPTNTQNYNKYGYVINNPLLYNDPTGEVMGWDDALIAIGIAIFTSVATDYYLNRPVNIGNMFQSVVMSLMSAGIADGIGTIFKMQSVVDVLGKTGTIIARAGAHAITQGTLSYMQGGNFLSGALSAAFASVAGDLLKLPKGDFGKSLRNPIVRFMTGAVVGGIGSKLAGGNFWMGAAIGGIVTAFNHMNHDEPPVDFNDDFYHDSDTGLNYIKVSDYLYEVYDQNLQPIGERYISGIGLKMLFADVRQQMNGIKIVGNILWGVGFAMTITGVGAPSGLVLMSLGGIISTSASAISAISYAGEGGDRWQKGAWEGGKMVVESAIGHGAGKLITPSKQLFNGYNQELGKQLIEKMTGDIFIPNLEVAYKTVY